MNNEKFYTFVKNITENDTVLAESIISAHKIIFENEEALEEGRLSKAAGIVALGASLLAPSVMSQSSNEEPREKQEYTVSDEQAQQLKVAQAKVRQMVKKDLKSFVNEYDGIKQLEKLDVYEDIKDRYAALAKKDQENADKGIKTMHAKDYERGMNMILRGKFSLHGVKTISQW